MSYKTFRIWQGIVAAVIGAVIAVSVVTGSVIVPIPTVIVGMLIIIVLRRRVRVKEVIADERVYAIAYRASRLTMQIIGIGMAVTGATLLGLGRGGSSVLAAVGLTLEYATCGLLVIYYIGYIYYSRKLGGSEKGPGS
jgi:uncharacterized membrane protein